MINGNSNLQERKYWLTLKYVERRFTQDWVPPAPTPPALDQLLPEDLKQFSQNFREQFKAVLLQCVTEDAEFRQSLRALLAPSPAKIPQTEPLTPLSEELQESSERTESKLEEPVSSE